MHEQNNNIFFTLVKTLLLFYNAKQFFCSQPGILAHKLHLQFGKDFLCKKYANKCGRIFIIYPQLKH